MKKISILVPCYNEVENVGPMSEALTALFEQGAALENYDHEILFIDNCSTDGTRDELEKICAGDKKIKAIFNVRNFGQFNSPYYGMQQTTGDCTVVICCDFQDPVEMVPQFVKEWEDGWQIVCGVKATSKENPFIRHLRTIYYRMIKRMSDVDIIEHFTGFGLYDKSFIDTLKTFDEPEPFLRGIVAELGGKIKTVPYEQQKRAAGKTHNNFKTLYDAAMLSFTSYTKVGIRISTFIGGGIGLVSLIVGLVYLIMKLVNWNTFQAGMAPILIGMFFLGAVQLFFIGVLGEYIMYIGGHVKHRPLVVVEKRLNFDTDEVKTDGTEQKTECADKTDRT
jgi:glycosyltransferase involved in cell wall biosynthesis